MKTELNIETFAAAISNGWRSAQRFTERGDRRMAIHCWDGVESEIDGMWSLVLYSTENCPERDELLNDIQFLERIAGVHLSNSFGL